MQSHVAIATSHAAEYKSWSCMRPLSFSLSSKIHKQNHCLTIWAASFCSQWTANMSSMSIWLCLFTFTQERWGGGSTLIPLQAFSLLPKPESAIQSRMDHMLTFPFVCMRQCRCCLYHFQRQVPALLNNGARKSVGLLQQQWSSKNNIFTAAICTCWMDNTITNTSTAILILIK